MPQRSVAVRPIACLLILAQLGWSCASTTSIGSVKEDRLGFPPVPPGTARIAVVLREFRNSAGIRQFDIIPDGKYEGRFIRRGSRPVTPPPGQPDTPSPLTPAPPPTAAPPEQAKRAQADHSTRVKTSPRDGETPLTPVEPGQVAREVTETLLVQSERFRVIRAFRLEEALKGEAGGEPLPLAEAARRIGVRYVIYGDLTQFEIRQKRSYWKMPLWALLLIGALFIKDKDTRAFALDALLRLMIYTPLNSPFWNKGLGWEDLILEVEVALALRVVDTQTGLVVHTTDAEITRTETVRNLDLIIWNTDKRLKITSSNAGKQIRFAAHRAISDLLTDAYPRLMPTAQ